MPPPDSPRRLILQPPEARSRRSFLRSAGLGISALGLGLGMTEEAWAAIETRAAHYGIVPGTRVDAQGRLLEADARGPNPFLAEIMIFAGNFAPRGWQFCNGQLLQIAQNTGLFSLLGTTYGGDGRNTFGVPNLQGRSPLHAGNGPGLTPRSLGQAGGAATVTLTAATTPSHTHGQTASASEGTTADPTGAVHAAVASGVPTYAASGGAVLDPTGNAGSSQPHQNMPPYLVFNIIIATQGLYPSRS